MGNSSSSITEDIFSRDMYLFRLSQDSDKIMDVLHNTAKMSDGGIFSDANVNTTIGKILNIDYRNKKLSDNKYMINIIQFLFKNNLGETVNFLVSYQDNGNDLNLHGLIDLNDEYQELISACRESKEALNKKRKAIRQQISTLKKSIGTSTANKEYVRYDSLYLNITPEEESSYSATLASFLDEEPPDADYVVLNSETIENTNIFEDPQNYRIKGFRSINRFFKSIVESGMIP